MGRVPRGGYAPVYELRYELAIPLKYWTTVMRHWLLFRPACLTASSPSWTLQLGRSPVSVARSILQMLSPVSTGFKRPSASSSNWRSLCTELFTALHLSTYRQGCSLGLDVSVSRRSRDVVSKRLGLVETWEGLGLDLVSDWKSNVSVLSRSRAIGSRLQANVYSFLLHSKIAPTLFCMQGVYIVHWFTSLLIYCSASAYQD